MTLGISHYHTEFPIAPLSGRSYAYEISRMRLDLGLSKMRSLPGAVTRRNAKVKRFMSRKISRDTPGYTFSMGYNACVGRCSGGGDYPRFSGSSLNRLYNGRTQQEKESQLRTEALPRANACLIKVAAAAAGALAVILAGRGRETFYNFLVRGDPEDRAAYIEWMSGMESRQVYGLLDRLGLSIHVLSPRSRGKIRDKATAFYRACPGSRVFCTLTFIAAVDDKTGVSILNKFLTVVRREHPGLQYFWVAERQTTNPDTPNNIHFHMILNRRLPVRRINALWVLQQYNAGLRGQNKYGERISREEIVRRVEAGTVGKVLNPVDIKKIRSINGLSSYLTKYITNQEKNIPFNCSVWHCSRRVSRLFVRTTVSPSAFRYCMSLANCRVDKKTGECFMPVKFPRPEEGNPFYMGVMINNKSAPLPYLKELEQCNKWIMAGLVPSSIPMSNDDDYRKHFLCEN
jgi:hypothetical protein